MGYRIYREYVRAIEKRTDNAKPLDYSAWKQVRALLWLQQKNKGKII